MELRPGWVMEQEGLMRGEGGSSEVEQGAPDQAGLYRLGAYGCPIILYFSKGW